MCTKHFMISTYDKGWKERERTKKETITIDRRNARNCFDNKIYDEPFVVQVVFTQYRAADDD